MGFGKYIIVDNYQPILFHKDISHDSFIRIFSKDMITSAGFFQINGKPTEKDPTAIEVSVFGDSTSLGQCPRDGDEDIIKRLLRETW